MCSLAGACGARPRTQNGIFQPQNSILRIREATGIRDLQMRGIRRTVATGLGRLKVPPVTISRVLVGVEGALRRGTGKTPREVDRPAGGVKGGSREAVGEGDS